MSEFVTVQEKTSLIKNRNYVLLWAGQSLSLIGDYFFSATIAIWIIDLLARGASWLPLATGGVAMSALLPSLIVGPLAGVFVDRWKRRWTMIWTDGMRLILVVLFLLMALIVSERVVLLISCFAILMLMASGQQFFLPARAALVADLLPPDLHPQGYGSLQQAAYLAQLVGPTVAVPLYVALGPVWAFTLNACSFLASLLFLLAIRVPAQPNPTAERKDFWREFTEGLRFFLGNRILVSLLISGMIFMFAGMAYNSFEYLYGIENLHIPATWLGLYVGCYGIGVMSGLPITAALAKRFSEVQVLWICLIGYGLTILVLSRVTDMIPGMICGVFLGLFNSSIFVTVRPLTVLVTPRNLIGRVMAFEVPMITIASLAGGLLASTLASTIFSGLHATYAGLHFGRFDTILSLVGMLAIGAGIFARLTLYRSVKELRAKQEIRMATFVPSDALREISLPQGTVRYVDCGDGPVFVFLHGLLANSWLWNDVIPRLAGQFRCLAPDLPLGAHTCPLGGDADLSPLGVAQLVADFLTALDLHNVTLIGNDTGGAICQLVIAHHAERISRLVLTNCDAFESFFPPLASPFPYGARILGIQFANLLALVLRARSAQRRFVAALAHRRLSLGELDSFFYPLLHLPHARRDMTCFLRGVSKRFTLQAAQTFVDFHRPVLLVWGEDDLFFPKSLAVRLQQAFPIAQLVTLPHSRAFVPLDQPEILARQIQAFANGSGNA